MVNCRHNSVNTIERTAHLNIDALGFVSMSRSIMSGVGDLSSSAEFSVNDVVS